MKHFYLSSATCKRCMLLWLLVYCLSLPLFSQTFPAGFNRVQVANGISNPTAMAFAPDGRIFVTQQNGAVRIIKNGMLLPTPFLQLSVDSRGERGLLGITLDPNFSSNQYVYLYYTLADGSRNRVSRVTGAGDVVRPNSEWIMLTLDPLSSATNHNGGALQFKNNLLYIAVGDNANGNNAQNLDTYHGKILRINTAAAVPPGNPFTSGSQQRLRVWAYGLRNPYTFDVQPGTGRIFVNDVGQNTWEEINDATTGGRNFGWPTAEGNSTNTQFANPVYAYPHGTGDGSGCAITGGVFFNPTRTNYPAAYTGRYFYQDLCNRWINMLDFSGTTPTRMPFATGLGADALSIDMGTDGNLYYLERSAGALFMIIYNTPPIIATQPVSRTVVAGQPVTFTVSAYGPAPISYQWQRNNVNIAGATGASYTIANVQASHAGQYRVIVSNTIGSVTSNQATLAVNAVNAAPVAQILTPTTGILYRAGQTLQFSGSGTDAEDGNLPASAFTWFVEFHHDNTHHAGPTVPSGVTAGSFVIPNTGNHSPHVWYRLYLVVKDAAGATDTVYRDIHPLTSAIGFVTQPAGLQIILDGETFTTPLYDTSVVGMIRTFSVTRRQVVNGVAYDFERWLHSSEPTHSVYQQQQLLTYTAVFKPASMREPDNPWLTVSGLHYRYYEGSWTTVPDFTNYPRVEEGGVTTLTLAPRNAVVNFGFYFYGYLNAPADGDYTIYLNSDDGSRLRMGTTILIENDSLHTARERSVTLGLKKGKHDINISYIQATGPFVLTASWSGPGFSKQIIPASAYSRIPTFVARMADTGEPADDLYLNEGGAGFAAYPNPANRELFVRMPPGGGGEVTISLMNLTGGVVKSQRFTAVSAGDTPLSLSVEDVSNGLYLLRIVRRGLAQSRTVSVRH